MKTPLTVHKAAGPYIKKPTLPPWPTLFSLIYPTFWVTHIPFNRT
jgi:hypothetical protein